MFDFDTPYIKELYPGQEKDLSELRDEFFKDSKDIYSSENSHLLFYIEPLEEIIRILRYCNNFKKAKSKIIEIKVNGKNIPANEYIIDTKEFTILGFIYDGYLSIDVYGDTFNTFVNQKEDENDGPILNQEKLCLRFNFDANNEKSCLTKFSNILKKSLDSIVENVQKINNANIVKNQCIEDYRRKNIGISQVNMINIVTCIVESNALIGNFKFIDSPDYFWYSSDYEGFHFNINYNNGNKFKILLMTNIDREFLLFSIEEIDKNGHTELMPIEIISKTNDKNSKWLIDIFFEDLEKELNKYGTKFKREFTPYLHEENK